MTKYVLRNAENVIVAVYDAPEMDDLDYEEVADDHPDVVAMRAALSAYSLYKTTVIGRMTDAELDAFDEGLANASTRLRRMWVDCQKIESSSPFFAGLKASFASTLGQERADAILAPEIP